MNLSNLEEEAIRLSSDVHELALCGLRTSNLAALRDRMAALSRVMEKAEAFQPRVVHIEDYREGEPDKRAGTGC